MKVIVAKTAGFCWGVRRAMDAVLEASARNEGGTVQTLGPLIHNPQALELIGRRGVSVAQAPSEVASGTVVIRAHGIAIQDLRGLKARQAKGELKIVNATCPEVAKVHSKIKKWSPKGYFTVILGSHGHAESEAHRSFAESGSIIVQNLEEAQALPDEQVKRVLVVAQTTFTVKNFNAIVDHLRERAEDLVVENTICEDTWTRQDEAREISAKVDSVVIVGGKNSANTRHLAELAAHYGKPHQFVETAAELDLAAFKGTDSVGVLAGASTPTWLVEEVVEALEQLGHGPSRMRRLLQAGLGGPALLALGSGLMTLGLHHWMGLPFTWQYPAITAAYVLSMFLLSPYLDPLGTGAKGPARARFLDRHRGIMMGLGFLSLAVGLGLAALMGLGSFGVVAFASAFGLMYRRKVKVGRHTWSFQAIPGSKDVLVALALAIVAVALPLWHHSSAWNLRAWAGVGLVAALALARTIIHGIQDMQNDQILGRETLPILLGRGAAKAVMGTVLALALAGVLVLTLSEPMGWRNLIQSVLFVVCTGFPLLHLWLYHERFNTGKAGFEVPLEASFYLVGLLALF